ncbi:ABC transporter permease [Devosia elaeis]|uniref:ABC transporter permease n=1 Tax=Devosia elaeis TaxID=1770058 RepID=A0A178HZW9_9HYPH|nr:iron ABC transporter permease [Devosia elaeis]OAM77614.1 ABC transporter permease [Devosia elaeis]
MTTTDRTTRPPLQARLRLLLSQLVSEPSYVIGAVLALALAYLVLAPMAAVLGSAVQMTRMDAVRAGASPGDLTFSYFQRVFTSPVAQDIFWTPLGNTMTVALFATALAVLFGLVLAMLVTSTNIWGRSILGFLLIIPYMLPSQALATAWITVFKNRRTGGSPGMLEALGLTPPDWLAYGPLPIVICLALSYFPFAFLLFSNALNKIDTQLEEAAVTLGARPHIVWRRILLPLLIPTTMSVLLLTVARTLGTFATPYVLGTPVGYTLLSTSLYSSLRSGAPGVAAVLAIVLGLFGVAMLLLDIWMVRNWQRFITVGGKGGKREPARLTLLARFPASAVAWGVFLIAAFGPLLVMFLSTIMREPGVFALSNFSLGYWTGGDGRPGVFNSPEILLSLYNSLSIAGSAAVICGVLGLAVGYAVVRLPGSWLSGFLRQVSFLPYLMPGMAFAAAFLTLFAVPRGPVPALYGSITLLILVMVVTYLPYASRSGISAMMQVGREPEEAGMVLGAGFFARITRILGPLQKTALVTAIILPFISGMKELSLVVMLVTPGTELLTTQSLRFLDYGHTQLANATILIIGVVVMLLVLLMQKVTKSSLAGGLGG